MAQYQAGMPVVYGKLGVHEIETVDLQSFFASIIGGTCNFEKHCLFFAHLTTKFI